MRASDSPPLLGFFCLVHNFDTFVHNYTKVYISFGTGK